MSEQPETVSNPAELIRLSAMTSRLLEETRDAGLDRAGCTRLTRVHGTAMSLIEGTLSGGLRDELAALAPPIDEKTVSEAELRVAQAQLVGWLDGLLVSLQAALMRQEQRAPTSTDMTPGGHAYL